MEYKQILTIVCGQPHARYKTAQCQCLCAVPHSRQQRS